MSKESLSVQIAAENIIFQVFYKDLNQKNWTLLLTSPSGPCRFDIFGELPPDIPWGLISRHDKLCSAWTDSFSGSHFFRTLPDYLGKMAGSRRKPWVSEAVFVVLFVPHISYLSPCKLPSYDTHTQKNQSINKADSLSKLSNTRSSKLMRKIKGRDRGECYNSLHLDHWMFLSIFSMYLSCEKRRVPNSIIFQITYKGNNEIESRNSIK